MIAEPSPIPDRSFYRSEPVRTYLLRVLSEVCEKAGAGESTLWSISQDGLSMEAAINCGPTPEIVERQVVPVAESVVGMVAASGLSNAIGPTDFHHPAVDQATDTTTIGMAAAPIVYRGERCGVLSVINPTDNRLFGMEDLQLLEWKAYLMRLIIEDHMDADADALGNRSG